MSDFAALATARDFKVIIAGAGFSGMCAAIKLKQLGIPFVIFEKGQRVGGTWYYNTYPGCCCDIPGVLYSFSFNPNPNWSCIYPPQAEILEYFESTAKKYNLYEHINFCSEIKTAVFDQQTSKWQVVVAHHDGAATTSSSHEADFFITGFGGLHTPVIPKFPGQHDFKGVSFHSSQWDHNFDWTNKTVAVIGSAASAVQIIPCLAAGCKKLSVFQRTPNWIFPRINLKIPRWIQSMFAKLPFTQALLRNCVYLTQELLFIIAFMPNKWRANSFKVMLKAYMRYSLKGNTELIKKFTPDYPIGCKRLLVSNDFYPTFLADNVALVTAGIKQIDSAGITDLNGNHHPADAIIYATGFNPIIGYPNISGINNSIELVKDSWRQLPTAYLGISVPEYPNLGILLGPNTGLGHNSILLMLEWQCDYIMQMIQYLLMHNLKTINVRPEVNAQYNADLQAALANSVWSQKNCHSWYQNADGKIFALWKGNTMSYKKALSKFNGDDYIFSA